jgi:A/G-specific adenine glycosylase
MRRPPDGCLIRAPRPSSVSDFAPRLIDWQRRHGRRDLPWQRTRDPYRVWLSEIMLQQTQVATVIGYYERFLQRFPDVQSLAAADLSAVMPLWAGLGYYARARNLHACARAVVGTHGGQFPRSAGELAQLPGVGRSTAAAIAAFCFDERAAILDGNVKRVLARHFGIDGDPGKAAVERRLWALAADLLPVRPADMPDYTQAVMDLGATLCTRAAPRCDDCPLRASCVARREARVAHLPTARARRAPTQRSAHWLILVRDDAVLLEARPPAGVWGGLLAPPAFDSRRALAQALLALGIETRPRAWPQRRHAFTHFTLTFTPHVVAAPTGALVAAEPGRLWLPLSTLHSAALPTPVRALLGDVQAAGHEAPRRRSAAASGARPVRKRAGGPAA